MLLFGVVLLKVDAMKGEVHWWMDGRNNFFLELGKPIQIYQVNLGERGTENRFSIYGREAKIFDKEYLFWERLQGIVQYFNCNSTFVKSNTFPNNLDTQVTQIEAFFDAL